MAHPNKAEGVRGHNDKLKRYTRDYGDADPAMKKLAPVNKLKQEGPEEDVGFGADSSAPKARGDRPARKTSAANPVSTYNRGGGVREKAAGGSVIARARGGRTRKPTTNVTIVVAPQQPQQQSQTPPPLNPALASALASGPGALPPGAPPSPPAGPPPGLAGAGPMGLPPGARPPGAMPPGLMPGRKRGGKVEHSDEREDKALVKQLVKPSALKGRARGGIVHMTAGSESGPGRLEKTAARARRKAGDKTAEV